jgi:hypothetical protein
MPRNCLDVKPAAVRLTPNPSVRGSRKEAYRDEDDAKEMRRGGQTEEHAEKRDGSRYPRTRHALHR